MSTLPLYNPLWMTYNISLALVPVFLGRFMFEVRNKWIKFFLGFFWLIFLPNSLYLFVDITHLFEQWGMVNAWSKLILLLEYAIVLFAGLLTYIYSLYPFEKAINRSKQIPKNALTSILLITLNFLVGLAVVLGRSQRINSWDLFIDIPKVVKAVSDVLSSAEMVAIATLIGLFANFLYFLLRRPVMKYTLRIFKTS